MVSGDCGIDSIGTAQAIVGGELAGLLREIGIEWDKTKVGQCLELEAKESGTERIAKYPARGRGYLDQEQIWRNHQLICCLKEGQ